MANITTSLKKIFQVEFANVPEKFLHKNSGEDGFTLGGIYQKANPIGIDWGLVEWLESKVGMIRASRMLFNDKETMKSVENIFYDRYWYPMRLDEVESQKIADEIFMMGVVSGNKQAVKLAQRLINVDDDGIIGRNTIRALNAFNEDTFDKVYDSLEVEYFENLAENKPRFAKFLNGWKNRSVAV